MLRRMLQQQIEVVASGGDPLGVSFDEPARRGEGAVGQFLQGLEGRLRARFPALSRDDRLMGEYRPCSTNILRIAS